MEKRNLCPYANGLFDLRRRDFSVKGLVPWSSSCRFQQTSKLRIGEIFPPVRNWDQPFPLNSRFEREPTEFKALRENFPYGWQSCPNSPTNFSGIDEFPVSHQGSPWVWFSGLSGALCYPEAPDNYRRFTSELWKLSWRSGPVVGHCRSCKRTLRNYLHPGSNQTSFKYPKTCRTSSM
jgi:hypothetical protein